MLRKEHELLKIIIWILVIGSEGARIKSSMISKSELRSEGIASSALNLVVMI